MTATSTDKTTGRGFNLVMQLVDPLKLRDLMEKLAATETKKRIDAALASLDYVHYARFLPLWEQGVLMIVTEFDGHPEDYVKDFAAVLDAEFSMILGYMKGQPRLPVSRFPDEFWDYVKCNTRPLNPALPDHQDPFSPYENASVLEILGALRKPGEPPLHKKLPPRPPNRGASPRLADVQANTLQGFRAEEALHAGLEFADPHSARAFVAELAQGKSLRVTPAAPWDNDRTRECVNIGFTFEGLRMLGIGASDLQKFPAAFREGPVVRAARLGDIGDSAPVHWGEVRPDGLRVVHAMVSLYAKKGASVTANEHMLAELEARHQVERVFSRRAAALGADKSGVHFGYRDGIAQPSIDGVHPVPPRGNQPSSPAGDFLLGSGYVNSRGGSYIGELPTELAENATYAAVRVIEQHVDVFDKLLAAAKDPELLAAKLMGRWRNGTPLVIAPEAKDGKPPTLSDMGDAALDAFDYVQPDDKGAGTEERCPVGAHIRRLNPRSGLVVGVPWGRLVIRRGLPYEWEVTDRADATDRKKTERGLFGLFFCGDLEAQFEFLMRVWANQDLSAPGLRGTRDAFIGSRSGPTPFRYTESAGGPPIEIEVPPLTRTAGSLYLLMPGLAALGWLGGQRSAAHSAPPAQAGVVRPVPGAGRFDPSDNAFRIDPYDAYAQLRQSTPVVTVAGADDHVWVLSHALVTEVNTRVVAGKDVFQKPGKQRDTMQRPFSLATKFGDGLFFMDPPRHTEVRAKLDGDIAGLIGGVEAYADEVAEELLVPFRGARLMEWVGDFASKLPMRVFMNLMGIPETDRFVLDLWTRAALKSHNKHSTPAERLAGATATMASRGYFFALASEGPTPTTTWGAPTLMAAMQGASRSGCPVAGKGMSPDEVMNTAVHFALGGYLSTEFLLTTGVYNLLCHPAQWRKLRDGYQADPALLKRAIWEMVRYDAPFQMADRWVENETELGGVTIKGGSIVTLVYGSANRDPLRDGSFDPTADKFDIDRRPSETSHFGFGSGRHECIGEGIAMRVAGAGFKALLDAFPDARIAEMGSWSSDPYFRTLDKLTLCLR